MNKKHLSEVMKYAKIIFFVLWIIGIFVGGKFMLFLATIFSLYLAITFKQTGRKAIEWQIKLHKFLHLKFEVSNFTIIYSQVMYLIIGSLFFIISLVKLLT